MKKKILLVEPAHKTKYPPLGLMKISTYHRVIKGDDVTFVRGCDKSLGYEYWDRIYIATLFTYYWKETIKTINFYKNSLFNRPDKIYIGGIMATLMPKDVWEETGVYPVEGLLDDPNKIDQDDNIIINDLPPDYEILKQVESDHFKYSNTDAYLGYTTRGCIRKCKFCAVSLLEKKYQGYIDIAQTIKNIDAQQVKDDSSYIGKPYLLLMDNNVLASKSFNKIINDIKKMGFDINGKPFGPTRKKRRVDFNQGLDGRILTEQKMEKLAQIPLEPMRIAFDDIKHKDIYIKAVRLAHKYRQKDMSNYILYNCDSTNDKPGDFYERLEINIQLNEEFASAHDADKENTTKTIIYSFPMRFIPINAKSRDVATGNTHWNKRHLRGLQVILNVIKGTVMPGREFFWQAFGTDKSEFEAILLMPDNFIRNRLKPKWKDVKVNASKYKST